MALFTDHPFRHVIKAILALAMGHILMKLMPHSIRKVLTQHTIEVVHLTQTSVTVLAIAALIYLVVLHHRSESGRVMSQNQEEMILIGALGAFWFAFLLAMRAFGQTGVDIDFAHPSHLFSASSGTAESSVVGAASRGGNAAYAPPLPPQAQTGGQASQAGAESYRRVRYGNGQGGGRKPYPCSPYDAYCVIEEWVYY
ncbi:hypothetical protein BV22DRAFT_1002692 [Leucogyrophana mollusca]|uniref:Uncharacterized protein n=1 Tax=Leucogyrophana mollusca TaxID=85980 RepID=A0ACB8BWK9_9AGAM|nr:hypothetical protein BV22DRAFT_1002692 [Leucogyrophana mollusca]